MLDSIVYGFHAVAQVEPPGVLKASRGFSSVLRNGVGDYTLTMTIPLNTNESGNVQATIQDDGGDASRRNITVQSLSLTQLRVRTFRVGAASEEHFWISVMEISPQ